MATNLKSKSNLIPTQAPAFPFAPVEYQQQYPDQFNRILTQYLKENDNINGALLGTAGGRYLSFPHIAAQDNTNQYATGTNVATIVKWSATDSNVGFTLNPDNTASTQDAGIYKIDYSLQFVNTDTQIHDVFVWLHVDGYDVVGSGSKFSIPNSHGGVPGFLVAYSSLTFSVPAGEKISLYWATNQAATSGGAAGVYMQATPAQTSPFAMPSVPSAVGSIIFVARP